MVSKYTVIPKLEDGRVEVVSLGRELRENRMFFLSKPDAVDRMPMCPMCAYVDGTHTLHEWAEKKDGEDHFMPTGKKVFILNAMIPETDEYGNVVMHEVPVRPLHIRQGWDRNGNYHRRVAKKWAKRFGGKTKLEPVMKAAKLAMGAIMMHRISEVFDRHKAMRLSFNPRDRRDIAPNEWMRLVNIEPLDVRSS